jgi:hypothetical protein
MSTGVAPSASQASWAAGHSACRTLLTWGRKLWACANCMTPRRRQVDGEGPGSRSIEMTLVPRRASAAPRMSPAGPEPMRRTRTASPFGVLLLLGDRPDDAVGNEHQGSVFDHTAVRACSRLSASAAPHVPE